MQVEPENPRFPTEYLALDVFAAFDSTYSPSVLPYINIAGNMMIVNKEKSKMKVQSILNHALKPNPNSL